ncbi:hypothetical protein PVA44_06035 [Entomospira nematocerorum]|uniref:Uncharacterized protein n=1 Tax=Entomospira nematocerorum TaxID=2719987 RepID=A0A968GER7_9SPIO|nr:hypothetical protein [Entomospira nematocera]NIZ46421.1 hypothetical protein [Entomospira nematocera]WDI33776.1 hypothetical protein PVA44_06035 [Entomospira nematocera]
MSLYRKYIESYAKVVKQQHQIVAQLLDKENYNSEILNTFSRHSQQYLKLIDEYASWIIIIRQQVVLPEDLVQLLNDTANIQNKTLLLIHDELYPKIQAYLESVRSLIHSSKVSFRIQPRYRYHKFTKFLDLNA